MQKLLSRLHVRCSEKNKRVVFIFVLALDCNVCIVDSLFYTSFGYLVLDKRTASQTFTLWFAREILDRLIARIGPPSVTFLNENTTWQRTMKDLKLDVHRNNRNFEICLLCVQYNGTFLQSTFFVGKKLYVSTGYNDAPKCKLRAGSFEWIVNNCIEETVKLYLE